MTYDALAMHAIHDELADTVVGGRIDSVYLIDARRVGLEIFAHGRRHALVYSLHPNDSRIYLSQERVARGTDQVTPFLLLLRKYVRGSRVIGIEQPRLERVLSLQITARPDNSPPRDVALVAEAMGRRSNLILVDEDGTIMDVLDRIPPSVNPSRQLLPHLRYNPPQRESKSDPGDAGLAFELEERAGAATGQAWEHIIRVVAGFSPLAARETLSRAEGRSHIDVADVKSWAAVAAEIGRLAEPLSSGTWSPSIVWRGEDPIAFAPYEIAQFPDDRVELCTSMSDVVERAGARRIAIPRFDRLRRPLLDSLRTQAEQTRRKRSSLERALSSADDAEGLRWCGEAILANTTRIEPGAASLEWEGRRIDLYPTLSPAENAQAYFKRYADARDAKKVVPPLIEETTRELAYLDEMALHITLAESERELNVLRRELEAAGRSRKPKEGKAEERGRAPAPDKNKPSTGPHRRFTFQGSEHRGTAFEGCEIFMGTSAVGNETVTFRLANPDDLWLHVRGAPGAHVIVRSPGKAPDPTVVEAAAQLAAAHSARRTDSRADVDCTRRRYVRKIAGGAPGQVTYREETTVSVRPEALDPRLFPKSV